MARYQRSKLLVTALLGAAWIGCAWAELPKACTSADASWVELQEPLARQELVKGNAAAFVAASRRTEAGLSVPCRAAVEREQPMRTRCSADERILVLKGSQLMVASAAAGNLEGVFVTFFKLDELLSQECWIAVNRPEHPYIRASCTGPELDRIASYAAPVMKATYNVLAMGDLLSLLVVVQEIQSKLSPACATAVQRAQQEGTFGQAPRSGRPTPLPGVYDHGGGTLSVPGVGACTPTGCMSF